MRRYKRIRKYPQRYNPVFGDAREWKNDDVASIVYMTQDGNINNKINTSYILSLLAECNAEDCIGMPSTFHIRESCVLKSQSRDTDTPMYMEALSDENVEEQFKLMDDEIQIIMIREIWEIVLRGSVADHNVLPRTCSFECKKEADWTIRKFKEQYFL